MRFKRFGIIRDDQGVSAVEFALLAPVLLMLLMGTVTLFDLFRTMQTVEKATSTVGDWVSRQSEMSQSNIGFVLSLMRHVAPSANDGGIRVSSFVKTNGDVKLVWSKQAGSAVPTTAVPVGAVPNIAEGDSVVLTETFVPHRAMIAGFGVDTVTFGSAVAYRPRFVSSIPFK